MTLAEKTTLFWYFLSLAALSLNSRFFRFVLICLAFIEAIWHVLIYI